MKHFVLLFLAIILLPARQGLLAQSRLQPGFDPQEYLELLQLTERQTAGPFVLPAPVRYKPVYQSPEVGLYNQWDLWLRNDQVAVISLRGTVPKPESWLENFYAAMVPACGCLQLNDSTTFQYQLAADARACVHAGWLTGLAYLSPMIVQKIREYAARGIHDYLIMGHSQGGALAFLLRSYLQYLPEDSLPAGLHFKTYCSAAPKPGNLYYAYDYDFVTRGNWGLRVVNTKDWVPETPFSVQMLKDMNEVNPFANIKPVLKQQKFFVRLYLKHVYNNLDRSTGKANKRLRKYLGHTVYKLVKKTLPALREPAYATTTAYMMAGTPVTLPPYPGYEKAYPDTSSNLFIHHLLVPYYKLVEYYYGKK